MIKALLLSLVLLSLTAHAQYQVLDGIVATVDQGIITESDLHDKMQLAISNLKRQNQAIPPEAELRKEILKRLILEKIQLQMAKRSGISVSDEQLNQAIGDIAKRNGLSLEGFYQELKKQNLDYQVMREQIRQDMIIQQVQQAHLNQRIHITEQEVDNYLQSTDGQELTAMRYHLEHILLPVSESASAQQINQAKQTLQHIRGQIIKGQYRFEQLVKGQTVDGVKVSGADFQWQEKQNLPSLFAEQLDHLNKGDISQPIRSGAGWHLLYLADIHGGKHIVHQVHARHILISPSKVRTDKQTKALADKLYEQVLEGQDFALLAKEYSEDKGSALQGGDLGWMQANQFVPEFSAALEKLSINEISKPVHSQFGWHIIQKLGERDYDITQEEQRNQAKQAIYQRKFSDELDAWLGKIRDEAFVEIKNPK